MSKTKPDLLNGRISKQIMLFFFPILLGTFIQQLYNTVDAFIVGKYVGKIALGAVGGTTGTLINLLVGFIVGVASGATVVVAQFYGKGDKQEVKKTVDTGMFLSIIMGLIMMVLGIYVSPFLLKITSVPDEMYDMSLSYMQIYFSSLIPLMIYNVGASILRAVGDSKRPLYFLIASCFVNIILDYIFVKTFNMGVNGAAIATLISIVVACLLTLIALGSSGDCYKYELKDSKFIPQLIKEIIIIGMPAGLQSVMYTVTNVLIQKAVNSFGTDTIAAWTAFGKIDSVFWMFSGAIGTACMTVAGQNFGANKIDRVRRTIRDGLIIHIIGTILISSLTYFFGPYLIELFSDDTNVIEIGYSFIKFLAPVWITFACVEVLSSCIRACGDSLRPMLVTAICICLFRIIYIALCQKDSIITVCKCYPISWVMASIVLIVYYLSNLWLKYCLKKKEDLIKAQGN